MFSIRTLLVFALVGYGSSTPQSYDTIVVGLGSAGVTAATTLAKAGRKVLGLEAMDRIGGRVKTVSFDGGIIEEGAEWIDGTVGSTVYDLAIKNNITVLVQNIDFLLFRSDGNQSLNPVYKDILALCLEKSMHPDNTTFLSAPDYLTDEVKKMLHMKYPHLENDEAFIAEFPSVVNFFMSTRSGTDDGKKVSIQVVRKELDGPKDASWHSYGYKTFFELMLNTYKGGPGLPNLEIKLSTEVSRVQWSRDGGEVSVLCADGARYTAQHVIVTVSLGVLKERYASLFSPPLPEDKVTAIEKVGFGVLDKVILNFPYKWFDANKMYVLIESDPTEDSWFTKHGDITTPFAKDTALTIWLTGEVAKTAETLPDDVVLKKSMELLRRFLSTNYTIPEPIGMIRSKWYTNPYTRGSLSYENLDAPKYPHARDTLAAPLVDAAGVPRVLFAGEATSEYSASVHAASDTGYREAMRLLNSK